MLDPQYLQNWFVWALHQNVPEREKVREALRAAAVKHGLVPPNESMSYTDPGPIDSTALAVEGHPLVLSPWVQVVKTSGGSGSSGGGGMVVSATNVNGNSGNKNNPITPMTSVSEASPFRRARHKSFMSDSDLLLDDDDDDDNDNGNNNNKKADSVDDTTANTHQAKRNLQLQCVAVPEEFYETLRAVHGVACEDYRSVSFQRYIGSAERFLLHHQQRWRKQAPPGRRRSQTNNNNNNGNGNNNNNDDEQQQQHAVPLHDTIARPVEFRRKVILQVRPDEPSSSENKMVSLMDKLLLEEEKLTNRNMIPTVEVHPVKLVYTVVQDDDDYSHTDDSSTVSSKASQTATPFFSTQHQHPVSGYVLVSRSTPAIDALLALLRVSAPNKATQSVRLWSQQLYTTVTAAAATTDANATVMTRATQQGDEYELVNMDIMKNNLAEQQKLQQPGGTERLTVLEWVERHGIDASFTDNATITTTTSGGGAAAGATGGSRTTRSSTNNKNRELHVLVETRRTVNSPWPRESFELENRLQVGDFVDAQDVAGKWYEAIVRQVDGNVVTVHYAGWASRWDAKVRRRREVTSSSLEGVSTKIKAPAPLWSQTGRWRERLCVGDVVEVRDSSSIVQRPKWYRGIVKKIGKPTDKMREIVGGADLEEYPVEGDRTKQEKLLILKRTQQVLVEVEQEKSEKAIVPTSPGEGDLAAGLNPQPPYLRWVNLYGEEICKINTHLKDDSFGPATLKYEFERHRKPVEILKPRNTLLGSGFMRESLRGTPPAPGSVGLQNLGNSCFLNATIQCLNHIEPLTQYFLQDKYSVEINRRNPLGSGGNVVTAYASLLKKMWSGEYSILAPRLLKQTVANFAPQFDNSYQHDSQEFCQFLMDGIHEDLNRVKNKPYVEELEGFGMEDEWTAIESWRKHLLRHDSIIVDHCQGMHRSHLTCPHCGRESIKFDVYSSISLPLVTFKDQKVINLEDCIEKFMEGEQLDERNAWYCPSCRKHVCALKMIALWSVPDILVLHLKRFTFDTCLISGGMLRSKIDAVIEFPIEGLDLTEYVLGPVDESAPPVYKLFGVSEHTGPTANSGHYTATVRNSIDDQWYRCNDSHVGRTSGEASMTGGAYVLFYQRTKGLSKWGGMHKVMIDQSIDPYGGLETDQEGFKQVKAKKKRGTGRK